MACFSVIFHNLCPSPAFHTERGQSPASCFSLNITTYSVFLHLACHLFCLSKPLITVVVYMAAVSWEQRASDIHEKLKGWVIVRERIESLAQNVFLHNSLHL